MQPTQSPGERPGLFSGKAVLLVSAVVLFIGVPVATWLTLRAVERDVKRTPLVYAERTSWQLLKARPETLDSANFITPVGESLRDTEFQLPPERRAIDLQAAKLAQSADFGSGSFSGTLPGAGGFRGKTSIRCSSHRGGTTATPAPRSATGRSSSRRWRWCCVLWMSRASRSRIYPWAMCSCNSPR